jgi:hypothetical protein
MRQLTRRDLAGVWERNDTTVRGGSRQAERVFEVQSACRPGRRSPLHGDFKR